VAWPSSEIAVMGVKGAVEIIFRNEIKKADDPEAKQKELEESYSEEFGNPYKAAERGFIDDVIIPHETRQKLISAFQVIETKVDSVPRKKHDNMPL
jgi:propionyl-CoA carboxylase beta chain